MAALLIFLVLGIASAYAQLLPSLEPLISLKTDAFEIYAPRDLEAQAARLSTFADESYARLRDFFGTPKMVRRIPVLLTDTQHSLNGFSTLYPSNRIVILLSSADPRSQLASLDDELRSVFLHELVHSVTLNERTGFWGAAAWLGGDWVAPEVWMMPQAMVEGSAVWVESRLDGQEGHSGAVEKGRGSSSWERGRLNDPAALEVVRLDRVRGERRELWEVSGLEDFYGAGSLPYLYGGLFVDYMSGRFGAGLIGRLWSASADGNLFRGFDGTLLSTGVLERETGESPKALWEDFIAWVDGGIEGTVDDGSAELFEGYVGAIGAGEGVVYYTDLERRGVYALRVGDGGVGRRLFAADGTLRNIFFNVRFRGLEIDWIRTTPSNQQIPARYRYALDTGILKYERDLPIASSCPPQPLPSNDPSAPFFIYDSWTDAETDIVYGLGRLGAMVLPARRYPDGHTEILEIPGAVLRWMSPGFRGQTEDRGESLQFALQIIPPRGLSRFAILRDQDGSWTLQKERQAPPWGVSQPVFLDSQRIVYRGSERDGRTSLRLLDISTFETDSSPSAWISLSAWEERHHPSTPETGAIQPVHFESARFPRALATSRFPYANDTLVGLTVLASDITERLSWSVFGGWDWSMERPIAAASLHLATGAWRLGISASDQAVPTLPAARRSSAGASLLWHRTFAPTFRSVSANLYTAYAGVQSVYLLSDVFRPAPDYSTWGAGASIRYESLYASREPPHGSIGCSIAGRAEYDLSSAAGFGGVSLTGEVSLKSVVSAAFYGAVAPLGGVAFAPGIRFLEHSGSGRISALDIPYPEFSEYRNFLPLSNWYVFGELQARVLNIELGTVLRLPLLPSLGVRRVTGNIGLRAAGLDIAGSPGTLSSAYAQIIFDTAILAGMGGATHSRLTLEAAWAFQPDKADGYPLHLTAGLEASLD